MLCESSPLPQPCHQLTWLQEPSAVGLREPLALGFQKIRSEKQHGQSRYLDVGNSQAGNGKELCVRPHLSKA